VHAWLGGTRYTPHCCERSRHQMIAMRLEADWWRVLAARVLAGLWGLAVAFGLDAFASLSTPSRFALAAGLSAMLAGGVGIAHWGVTPALGLVVLAGGCALSLAFHATSSSVRSDHDEIKRS